MNALLFSIGVLHLKDILLGCGVITQLAALLKLFDLGCL